MSSRTIVNIILVILLIGLGVISLKPSLFTSTPQQAVKTPLTSLSVKDITKISIHNQQGNTHLTLQNDNWQVTEPIHISTNQYNVNQLLELSQLQSRAHYPADPAKLAEFGLTAPIAILRLNDVEIRFGITDPIHQSRYLAIGNTIHLIDDQYSYLLQHAPGSLMDTSIVPGQPTIKELLLPSFKLIKQDGNWQLLPSNGKPIPQQTLQKLMKSLSQDDLVRYVDEWRYAQALKVDLLTTSTINRARQASRIQIQLVDDRTIVLQAETLGDEAVLRNPELGVQYIITNDKFTQLLAPPSPESEQPPSTTDSANNDP